MRGRLPSASTRPSASARPSLTGSAPQWWKTAIEATSASITPHKASRSRSGDHCWRRTHRPANGPSTSGASKENANVGSDTRARRD
jgi:hypothetical protein